MRSRLVTAPIDKPENVHIIPRFCPMTSAEFSPTLCVHDCGMGACKLLVRDLELRGPVPKQGETACPHMISGLDCAQCYPRPPRSADVPQDRSDGIPRTIAPETARALPGPPSASTEITATLEIDSSRTSYNDRFTPVPNGPGLVPHGPAAGQTMPETDDPDECLDCGCRLVPCTCRPNCPGGMCPRCP